VSAAGAAGPRAFGVYVHVPFCRMRCDYCAFATYTDRDHLMARYVHACRLQLERAGAEGATAPATSVFFGGGTPSRLPAEDLAGLLDAIARAPDAEVTVECNPEDVTAERLTAYREAGVTRISLGVQSTSRRVLASLGRDHDPETALRAGATVAAAGFGSWNMDLIVGAAGETDDEWERSLADVLALGAPHVSIYALTVEPGTPLARVPARHPDDDVQARRYLRADAVLEEAGYGWEEISNWSLPGHGCRHNQLYWAQGDYLGVGSAAHSHRAGTRWWHLRTPERFVAALEQGRSPVAGREVLSADERRFERLALALRTPAGVPTEALPRDAGTEGLVVRAGGRAVLTPRGRLLANEVTSRLVDPGPVSSPHDERRSGP
jgi:putative oxygen-independent coproporphyrinogen III oxidase